MNDAGGRFFFVHLQKTAGTALLRRLRHQFGSDAVYPLPGEQGTAEAVLDVGRLERRVAELGGSLRVVTGHFPLATVDRLGGAWSTFTILRDPVERTLSFLRHQSEVEPRFAGMTLEQIQADPLSSGGLVTNHMVKMLSLTPDEMTAGALTDVGVDDARLATAQQQLRNRIDVMGLQEHFEVFCTDLEAAFGWDLGPSVFMNRTRPQDAPESLREQIRAANDHDVRLHRYATELWRERHPGA